ncbi:huntingtin-like [Homalodisca vitripennis]|uniref:huntingtin-like n=1 Tax=Homalodisca vitripennis TaxID=197043 RepID=UPI001EEB9D43|nr:huntingtin-like [Homalodisca vitripennis]
MEALLQLCDDPDSNVRMVADESLNRIIRAMMDNNVVKVHMELHKEIKKNGNVRSLRAVSLKVCPACPHDPTTERQGLHPEPDTQFLWR